MESISTRPHRKLTFTQTLIVCGIVFALYKIFRNKELGREIEKFVAKNMDKDN
jgi:hypothetical protein